MGDDGLIGGIIREGNALLGIDYFVEKGNERFAITILEGYEGDGGLDIKEMSVEREMKAVKRKEREIAKAAKAAATAEAKERKEQRRCDLQQGTPDRCCHICQFAYRIGYDSIADDGHISMGDCGKRDGVYYNSLTCACMHFKRDPNQHLPQGK